MIVDTEKLVYVARIENKKGVRYDTLYVSTTLRDMSHTLRDNGYKALSMADVDALLTQGRCVHSTIEDGRLLVIVEILKR